MADGSLSQFKATLARKIARDEKRRGRVHSSHYKVSDKKEEYNFPKLSEAELEKVKAEIRQTIRKEKLRERIFFGIAFVVFIAIILYLI